MLQYHLPPQPSNYILVYSSLHNLHNYGETALSLAALKAMIHIVCSPSRSLPVDKKCGHASAYNILSDLQPAYKGPSVLTMCTWVYVYACACVQVYACLCM